MPRTPSKERRKLRRSQRIRATATDWTSNIHLDDDDTTSDSSSSVCLTAAFSSEAKAASKKRPVLADRTNLAKPAAKKRRSRPKKDVPPQETPTLHTKQTVAYSPYTLVTNESPPLIKKRPSFHGSDSDSRSSVSTASVRLPPGVVDLYSKRRSTFCACHEDHNSSRSVTDTFHATYGREYYQSLKEIEGEHLSLSQSSGSCSSPASATSLSISTPPGRVHIARTQPSVGSPQDSDSSSSPTMDHQPMLTHKMRAILVDWLIELSVEYDLRPNTLHLAVALINKSLECGKSEEDYLYSSQDSESTDESRRFIINKDMFQCLGCACMFMACKIEEVKPPTVSDFVYVSADCYTKGDIVGLEMEVCTVLKFRLCQVTPFHFVEEFVRASQARRNPCCQQADTLRYMVYYLLELALLSYRLTTVSPRLVAAAAVYLARVTLHIFSPSEAADGCPRGLWTKTLEHYTGFPLWDLEDAVTCIHALQLQAEESQFTNAFSKYSKAKFRQVSLKTVPTEDDLGFC